MSEPGRICARYSSELLRRRSSTYNASEHVARRREAVFEAHQDERLFDDSRLVGIEARLLLGDRLLCGQGDREAPRSDPGTGRLRSARRARGREGDALAFQSGRELDPGSNRVLHRVPDRPLQLAFSVFGSNPVTDLLEGIIAFLPKLFVAALIIVITAAVASGVKTLLESLLGAFSYGRTLALIAVAAIWVIGVSASLNQIEVAPEIVNGLFYAMLALLVGDRDRRDRRRWDPADA